MTGCLNKMYIGKTAETMERQARRAISRGTSIPGLYLITFASNGTDQLDVIHSRFLLQKKVRKQLPVIAGFGIGKEETMELVTEIVRDAFRSTGNCDLQRYLLSIQPEGRR